MNNLEIAIKGVKIACKILEIPEPKVYFFESNKLPNPEITGMFTYDNYEIIFNKDWVLSSEWIEIIVTCFHESRHAYQCYSIKNNKNEPANKLYAWQQEFENYHSTSGENNSESDIDYLKQKIEIDAIRFTYFKIKELLILRYKFQKLLKT